MTSDEKPGAVFGATVVVIGRRLFATYPASHGPFPGDRFSGYISDEKGAAIEMIDLVS